MPMTKFCGNCGEANVDDAQYCANCGELLTVATNAASKETLTQNEARESPKEEKKTLYRSRTKKILSGLSAGLADYFGLDVSLVRFLWLASFVITSGATLVGYIVLAAITPLEPLNESNEDIKNTKNPQLLD